jgi:3-oxoacyl-[acyl-carrier protein] reductase
MSAELAGKVAIVTGAARGLGLVLMEELARIGMRVVGVDVRAEEVTAAAARVADRHGAEVLAVPADVGREPDAAAMVDRTLQAFGRIDVLVNNAGVRFAAPVWATETTAWDHVHDTNLKGHFLCTREVLNRDMLARREGTLVFVSSLAGTRGTEGASAYSASKHGVLGFAHSVAKDLKNTNIRVTVIAPGRIDTPMAHESEAWPLGLDWLNPEHVARTIVFCIEQDANTIVPELHIYHRAQL